MVLALDVHYKDKTAKAVASLASWSDTEAQEIFIEYIKGVEEYIPGEFYKRELPCLLKIIESVDLANIEVVVIDGFVFLDNNFKEGLGAKLWTELNKSVPVIGVAKTPFYNNKETVMEVYRGESKKPIYVSAIGIDLKEASEKIRNMKGEFRVPTLLKQIDKMSKED